MIIKLFILLYITFILNNIIIAIDTNINFDEKYIFNITNIHNDCDKKYIFNVINGYSNNDDLDLNNIFFEKKNLLPIIIALNFIDNNIM